MSIQYVEAQYTEFIHGKAASLGVPLSGTFEITPCCNMACRMCYVRMTKKQQEAVGPLHTAEEWLRLGKICRDQGMLYLLITGGEPFYHPQIREILVGLHRMGLVVSINTNATMIDEQTLEWLKKCPPSRMNITLYGASDATYGRLCCNPKGFTQVTHAIDLLQQAGISIKLNCSVTPYNSEDVPGIFAYAEDHKLVVQATSYMFPPVRRDESMIGHNDRFTPREAARQTALVDLLSYGKEKYLKRMEEDAPMVISGELGEDCPNLTEGDGVRCRAGKCSFWVTWEGKLLACGLFPQHDVPNVFREDFAQAWEQTKALVQSIRLPAACAACEVRDQCHTCAAMVYTETGTFDQVPRYRCDMAKAYGPACKELERQLRKK